MTAANLLSASAVSFRQASTDEALQRELAEWWSGWVADRPHLYNGALLGVQSCDARADGGVEIVWFVTSYAHYLQRATSSPVSSPARALFCSLALLSASGSLVIGQMSDRTSSPGRLQLPGGNIDTEPSGHLSIGHCAQEARREFDEETGVPIDGMPIKLWRIKTGGAHGDVGLIFLCRSALADEDIQGAFAAHLKASDTKGESPEFSRLVLMQPSRFQADDVGPCVDYLPAVMALLARLDPELPA